MPKERPNQYDSNIITKAIGLAIITVINFSMNNPSILFEVGLVHLCLRLAFPDPLHEFMQEKANDPGIDQSSSYWSSISEHAVHFELEPRVAAEIYKACQGRKAQPCELAVSKAVGQCWMHQKLHVGHDLYEEDRAEDHCLIEHIRHKESAICNHLEEVEVEDESVSVLPRDYLA